MKDERSWRQQWWIRRFAPAVCLGFGAFYGTFRGRQYAHGDALAVAAAGTTGVAILCVAYYLGLPIFGRRFNASAERFEPITGQKLGTLITSWLLTATVVGAGAVVAWLILTASP